MWEFCILFNKPGSFPQTFWPTPSPKRSADVGLSHNYRVLWATNIERSLQVTGNTPFVFTVLGLQLSAAFEPLPGYDSPKLSQQNALLP